MTKQTWDTRAWLLGILGGSVSVACFVPSTSPRVAARLNAALPDGGGWVSGAFAVISILLLPAVLIGIARRRIIICSLQSADEQVCYNCLMESRLRENPTE